MLRQSDSRRGMADLIVMILMIVLLIGVSVLAFIAFDRAKKEEAYLANLKAIPAQQKAEMDATRARFAQVSNLIGFKGNADFSSPSAIKAMLEKGGERNGVYLKISGQNPEDKASSTIKGVSGEHAVSKLPKAGGTREEKPQMYSYADGITVLEAIAAQDKLIHDLVKEHIPSMQKQAELQRTWTKEAADARKEAATTKFNEYSGNVEAANRSLNEKNAEAITAEEALSAAAKRETEAYDALSGQAIMDAIEEKFRKMRETLPARQSSVEMQDQVAAKQARRMKDDQRDADGYVFLVDTVSGWVWINIGQKSDVRLDMSFQVLRADPSLPSLMPVGEVRVKEILRGNIARCRIDALDDPTIMPKQGDIIRNPNFNDRQYFSYCLVGKFGGGNSRFTYQQWVTKLTDLGFRIVPTIRADTDVAILGADWNEDPIFKAAREEGLDFERMTEKELMWFLGLEGPESR